MCVSRAIRTYWNLTKNLTFIFFNITKKPFLKKNALPQAFLNGCGGRTRRQGGNRVWLFFVGPFTDECRSIRMVLRQTNVVPSIHVKNSIVRTGFISHTNFL